MGFTQSFVIEKPPLPPVGRDSKKYIFLHAFSHDFVLFKHFQLFAIYTSLIVDMF